MSDVNSKMKELMDKLEVGIRETMDSTRYKDFLRAQSKFHNYSFNNTMLIYMQNPGATQVAGFKTWQKLERFVKKGEKGMKVLVPAPYKYVNLENGEKLFRNKYTNAIKQQIASGKLKEYQGLSFKIGHVFDVSQTDGKELPDICKELQGNSINAENIINAIKQVSDVPVVEKNILSGAKGYYDRNKNIIALQEGMSLDQTAKTLLHEYAHSQLHNTENGAAVDKATKEIQAESVAFIVSDRFGIDTSEYTFDYLANWSSGKELKELKSSFDLIQKTANTTIEKVETFLTQDIVLEQNNSLDGNINQLVNKDVPLYKMFYTGEQNKEAVEYQKNNNYKRVWVPESQGGNGDMWVVYKDVSVLPKWVQDFAHSQEINGQNVDVNDLNTKDRIIATYSKEFSAIKYISNSAAVAINNLNLKHGKNLSIKELKSLHKQAGKNFEASGSIEDKKDFENVQSVVDDLKQAQLKEKNVQARAKANQLSKATQVMEMV